MSALAGELVQEAKKAEAIAVQELPTGIRMLACSTRDQRIRSGCCRYGFWIANPARNTHGATGPSDSDESSV